MKFKIQNLGFIKDYELELGNLTIICGKNNTGKTYLSYSVFGYFEKMFHEIIKHDFISLNFSELKKCTTKNEPYKINISQFIKEIKQIYLKNCEIYPKRLFEIFNANTDEFLNTKFEFAFAETNDCNNLEFSKQITGTNDRIEKLKNTEFAEIHFFSDNELYENLDKMSFFSNFDKHKHSLTKHEINGIAKAIQYKASVLAILNFTILNYFLGDVFLISSERTSLQTFQKEIDQYRSRLMLELQKNKTIDLTDLSNSRFSYPIEKQMDFIRNIDKLIKENSYIKERHPEIIEYLEEIIGIKYEYLNDQLMVNVGNKLIPQYMASSSVRSLADLHVWLKHKASIGDLLMIDEPELNLHPENQIKLARLFAKLIHVGINVWITTHSDYIIKEINNLLLLSNDFEEKDIFMTEFGYQNNEILTQDQVKIYIAKEDGTLQNVEINNHGMTVTTFDQTIEKINEISNSLFNLIE